jgi:hypothetical protein
MKSIPRKASGQGKTDEYISDQGKRDEYINGMNGQNHEKNCTMHEQNM